MCQLSISILDKKATYVKLYLKHTVLCVVLSRSVGPTLCDLMPVAHQAPLSIGILQARILEWVAMPCSRGSSQHRDWTQVSCMAGGFFTIWVTGKPIILGWISYPFSRGSSQPRNPTGVSCIAGRFFTSWPTREAPKHTKAEVKKGKTQMS